MRTSPREHASCLSVLLFWWLRKVIVTGLRRDLAEEDVYPILPGDRAGRLGDILEKKWIQHLQACAKKNKKPSFRWVLFLTYWRRFIYFGLFSMLEECVYRILQVIALGVIIEYFSLNHTKSHSTSMAYLAAVGIVLGSLCFLISFHWSAFNTHHICTHMRIAVSTLIYRKTLRLSQATMRNFSVGQLITMLSSDVFRLDMQELYVNYLWIAPIQLSVVIYLLSYHYEFGPASLSGLVLLVVFVIFQYFMGKYVSSIRKSKIGATNKRLRIITEVLDAFYNIKLYGWENAFSTRAKESRREELKFVRKTMILRILNASFSLILTKMTVFITILLYIYLNKEPLDPHKVFITVLLYEHVRINLAHLFTHGCVDFAEVSVTARRLTEFLLLEERYVTPTFYDAYTVDPEQATVDTLSNGVYLENVQCKWHVDQENTTLDNVNLEVSAGQMLALVGPTGSGKSSYLAAMLGELPTVGGKITVQGKIAYIAQTPWLFPGTIRQNIVFGLEYNHDWYLSVLDMCGLKADFANIEDGDQTKIIRAVLSVGQKARISLARGVYSNCDIYLMDDPLSCIDVRLQRHILDKCIRGALKNKTVILVTHQLHFLQAADAIGIVLEGKLIKKGTYKELLELGVTFSKEVEIDAMDDEDIDVEDQDDSICAVDLRPSNGKRASVVIIEQESDTNKLIVKEYQSSKTTVVNKGKSAIALKEVEETLEDPEISSDKIGVQLVWAYLRASSTWFQLVYLLILCFAVQTVYTYSEIYLEEFTEHEETRTKKAENNRKLTQSQLHDREKEITIYCVLIPSLVILSVLRSLAMFQVCMKASFRLFVQLLNSLLHAKAKFFESSSVGHGINRFSKDILVIDELIPTTLYDITGIFLEIMGAMLLLCHTMPWAGIPCGIFIILVGSVVWVYHKSAGTLKRLEANARSPIYAHTAKTLEGLATIRSYEQERIFLKIFEEMQDNHTAAWYMYISLYSWLAIVVDFFAVLLVASITMMFVLKVPSRNDNIAAEAGLAIAKVIELSVLIQVAVTETAHAETELVSVERVLDYTKDAMEDDWVRSKNQPPPDWPKEGQIVYDNVTVLLNEDRVLLADINIEIPAGEKIGIVGRSGSGKTTLLNTLFRITDVTQGSIMIDNVNIKDVGLHQLRHKLSIIPQIPYIFSGTLRMNLDPLGNYPDQEIWDVLNEVNLFETIKTVDAGLDTIFSDAGFQISPGQAQLIGLARVLLQKNKILCLDHAMNNLDPSTHKFIQRKIKEKFAKCTILTIGHALQPLMNSTKIMVIDAGRVVDFGDPYALIQKKGPLYSLISHLGKKNAEEITRLAKEWDLKRRASRKTDSFLDKAFT